MRWNKYEVYVSTTCQYSTATFDRTLFAGNIVNEEKPSNEQPSTLCKCSNLKLITFTKQMKLQKTGSDSGVGGTKHFGLRWAGFHFKTGPTSNCSQKL